MKKARIIFNGVEKIFPITEDFHTKDRILSEMADIWSEESIQNPPEKYKHLPFIEWPQEELDNFLGEKEVDLAFDKMSEEFDQSLMQVIEETFNVKVNKAKFIQDSYLVTEREKEEGIVMHYVAGDE
jgi:hypothetical protein